MTNVSSLYNFRSTINGASVNASSASRAVRNALKRYAKGTVKLEDIKIEHKVKSGPHGEEWAESKAAMELLHKNAAKITPDTPKTHEKKAEATKPAQEMTLGKALSHLSRVSGVLKSREHLSDEEYNALREAMDQVSEYLR